LLIIAIAYAVHVLVERRYSHSLKALAERGWDRAENWISRLFVYARRQVASALAFAGIARDRHPD